MRERAHFGKAVGRRASVRTASQIGGRRRFRGEIVAAGENAVTLAIGEGPVEVPYGEIVRGNLIEEGR